jgi:hypothetical protein
METRNAYVTICGRKEPGYPQIKIEIEFDSIDTLIKKIDEKIEETDFRKVDVYIENGTDFTDEEMEKLESENIFISDFY